MRTLLIAACFLFNALPSNAATPVVQPKKLKPLPAGQVQITVEELHCKTCAKKLARKLYSVPGVLRVVANVQSNTATITLQRKKQVSMEKLWRATIAAEQSPVKLRFADRQLVAKDFPKVKPVTTKTAAQRHAKAGTSKPRKR